MCYRRQRVVVNGVASEWAPVNSGGSQGSVLGPVLFILYINDVDVRLNNLISKFADDTKIGKSVLTGAGKDLHIISSWSERWRCRSTWKSSRFFKLQQQQKKYDYKMCGAEVKSVQCAEDLGGKIPSNLKSSQHNNDAAHEGNNVELY